MYVDIYICCLQITYMISAWARMCKILGKEFQQYLPLVMGPVLKAASHKPEVALVDSEWSFFFPCLRSHMTSLILS